MLPAESKSSIRLKIERDSVPDQQSFYPSNLCVARINTPDRSANLLPDDEALPCSESISSSKRRCTRSTLTLPEEIKLESDPPIRQADLIASPALNQALISNGGPSIGGGSRNLGHEKPGTGVLKSNREANLSELPR